MMQWGYFPSCGGGGKDLLINGHFVNSVAPSELERIKKDTIKNGFHSPFELFYARTIFSQIHLFYTIKMMNEDVCV